MSEQVNVTMDLELTLREMDSSQMDMVSVVLGHDPVVLINFALADDGVTVVVKADATGFDQEDLADFFETAAQLVREGHEE